MKVSQSCLTLCDVMTVACQAPVSMEFSRQETGVGWHALLQGVFPTQGSNPSLLYCRPILYHLSHIAAYSLGMKYSSFSAWLYTHEVFSPLYSITFSLSTTQSWSRGIFFLSIRKFLQQSGYYLYEFLPHSFTKTEHFLSTVSSAYSLRCPLRLWMVVIISVLSENTKCSNTN